LSSIVRRDSERVWRRKDDERDGRCSPGFGNCDSGSGPSAYGDHVPYAADERKAFWNQYCSFNDVKCSEDVDGLGGWLRASSERIVAHLAFDAAHVATAGARREALLENFDERGLVEGFTFPRGESWPLRPVCGE